MERTRYRYWKGTREEYFKLYDFSAAAVLRALPEARIGGPDTTGPGNARASEFLEAFLEHCAHQKNHANGRVGSHLDFVSFHPKGSPTWHDHVQMELPTTLPRSSGDSRSPHLFSEWQHTPIILGGVGPGGLCGLFRQGLSSDLVSQPATVRDLHSRSFDERSGGGSSKEHQFLGSSDLGI